MPLDSARPTVLHVDDRDENRHLRRRLLEGAGFRVIEASTIREALVAAYQERPDVMLTDVGLPDGSGFELAQQIKGNPLTAHIRVVQISAHFTEPEYRVRGLDSGADAYLIEPIEPAELVAVIRAIVRSRRTEDLLNAIIGQAPMLVAGADQAGRIALFNPACEALTGYARDAVLGRPFVETLIAPADAEIVTRRLREARTADAPQEVRWRTAGGADRVVQLRLIAVAAPEGGAWTLSIGHDVTEEREAQHALGVSEGRLRTILDNTTAHVYVVDASGRFLLVNRAFGETFKADPGTVVGRSLHDFFAADVARQFEENNRVLLRTGAAIEFEEIVPQDDGLHTYISVKAPLVDAGGEVYAICGISTDITERKRLEQDLRQADRRKDEFIATVAHELRQPLAPIVTALELVKRGASAETARRAFDVIQRQVGQMERLIEDLLDASRIVQGKVGIRPQRIALNDVITSALSVVRPLVREREQELRVQLPDDPVPITADPQRLQQVFSNLLDNAAKFTPRGGRIGLTVEPGLETVVVRVTDTGRGIPAEMLPGIFDLFAQGAADERGIGVGLAVVRGLVERHGGSVMAYSEGPGKGAEFVVRLPREKEIAQEAAS